MLAVAEDNSIWISNNYRGHLINTPSSAKSKLIRTEIRLEPGETVTELHSYSKLVMIHTSQKRLFISKVLKPSMCGENAEKDSDGVYPALRKKENKQLVTDAGTTLAWPEPAPRSFAVPYSLPVLVTEPEVVQLDITKETDNTAETDDAEADDFEGADDIEEADDAEEVDDSEELDDDSDSEDYSESTYKQRVADGTIIVPDLSTHNFGVRSMLEDSSVLENAIHYSSVHYVTETGFNRPILNVDHVIHYEGLILFNCGTEHYFYYWDFTAKKAMWSVAGLVCTPTQHDHMTYYQLCLPFATDEFVYKRNFLYLRSGSYTHVIVPCFKYLTYMIRWSYFQLDETTADSIYLDEEYNVIVIQSDHTYMYYRLINKLELIIKPGTKVRIVLTVRDNFDELIFVPADSSTVYRNMGYTRYEDMANLFDRIVRIAYFSNGKNYVIIDADPTQTTEVARAFIRGKSICINVNNSIGYCIMDSHMVICDESRKLYLYTLDKISSKQLRLVNRIKLGPRPYATRLYTYRITTPGLIEEIDGCYKWFTVRVDGKYYRCEITDKKYVCTPIEPTREPMLEPNLKLIKYATTRTTIIPINIETYASCLDRFVSMAEMFSAGVKFLITYSQKGKIVSHGVGARRTFVHDALAEFSWKYLSKQASCVSFNIDALSTIQAPQLFAFGRMLRMAIITNKSYISIRLPVALLAAIKEAEPTTRELEYFAHKEDKQAFEIAETYKYDLSELANLGFGSYEECLKQFIQYDSADPVISSKTHSICKLIADGFNSLVKVANIDKMDLPTLDLFISGDYSIDRVSLKKQIKGKATHVSILTDLIDKLPELDLETLLRNWTGSSVRKPTKDYYVGISNSERIEFKTCSMTLDLPSKFFTKTDSPDKQLLIDTLVTPVDHIRG